MKAKLSGSDGSQVLVFNRGVWEAASKQAAAAAASAA